MGFLFTLFRPREKSSASAAKDRLLDVLIHDRVKLSPATIEQIRQEILGVLSKYMEVDREAMEVTLIRADGAHQLTAHVPIRRGESFHPMEADEDAPTAGGEKEHPKQPKELPKDLSSDSHGIGGSAAARRSTPSPTPRQLGPQRKKRH